MKIQRVLNKKVLATNIMQNQQYKFGKNIDKDEAEHQKIIWLNFKEFVMFFNAFLRLPDKIRWKIFHKISSNYYGYFKRAKVWTKKKLKHYHYMLISREYVRLRERNKKVDMKKRLLIFTNTNLLTNIRIELTRCSCTENHQPKSYSFVIITSNWGWQMTEVNEWWTAIHFSAQKMLFIDVVLME